MESMMTLCPDAEHLCEAPHRSTTAAQVENRFAMHAMMATCWACYLHGVPEDGRATLDEAPTSGLLRLWNELRYQDDGGVEPAASTFVLRLHRQTAAG